MMWTGDESILFRLVIIAAVIGIGAAIYFGARSIPI